MSRNRRIAPSVFGWLVAVLVVGGLAPLALAVPADHLIISEVNWQNSRAPKGSQCIKIVNPTVDGILMEDVYLTDATLSPNSVYYNITLSDPGTSNPGGTASQDFHVRFPAGYTMAAADTVIIALNGSEDYFAEYGVLPDFELFEDGLTADEIPDMVAAFPGSINALYPNADPILDRTSESLILYSWDGTSDLVDDLDYLIWGSNENFRVSKTGVVRGSSTYEVDTATGNQITAVATINAGFSLRRVDGDEGDGETDGGLGNGITGHDETGEDLATTFQPISGLLVPAPPAALAPSAPVFSAPVTEPATPHAGLATTLSVTLDSFSSVTGVTFHYSLGGIDQAPLTGVDDAGTWTAQIALQPEGTAITWFCEAVNADGGTSFYPASAPLYFSSFSVEAAPVAGEGADKLLITEVNVGPHVYPYTGMSDIAAEFIEIHNPNDFDVDLSDYYLSDAISHVSGDQLYWNIALGATEDNVGGGNYNDFTARFPDGFMIEAGAVIVISVAGSDLFQSTYGELPDLELYEDGVAADAIPDMRPVFTNGDGGDSIYTPDRAPGSDGMPDGIPDLEDHYGEPLIFFQWTEGAELVTDIDIFIWGEEKVGSFNYAFDKSGVTVGSSTYADDTPVDTQDWYTAMVGGGSSYQRVDLTEGTQAGTGSNGVDGRDETSENWSTTFEAAATTPGELEGGGGGPGGGGGEGAMKLLITEISAGPNFYPDFGGMDDIASEFIEIHNPNDVDVDLSDFYLTDSINYSFGSNQVYYRLVLGATESNVGGGNYNDFHARFPEGYTIEANGTVVISIAGSDLFYGIFGEQPDLELYEDGATADDIPDMRPLFTNGDGGDSIFTEGRTAGSDGMPRGIPELEEYYGEPVILYYWDGESDLVTDIDAFIFGETKTGDFRQGFDKTGITIGSSTYLSDTAVDDQNWFTDTGDIGTVSYHRINHTEGDQVASGGNGVDGRDETSEDWTDTFAPESFSPGYYPLANTGGGGSEPQEEALFELQTKAVTFLPREGEEYNFKFRISATNFEFRLRIFDRGGRLIRTLYDSRFDDSVLPGIFKNVPWDGRSDTYELVRAGMYIAHFSIVDVETGTEETKAIPVVVASRLEK